MNGAADVIDELDDRSLEHSAGLDSVIKLRGEHSVLSRDRVGEEEAEALLRRADGLDLQNLHERLRVDVSAVYRRNGVRRQIHRH